MTGRSGTWTDAMTWCGKPLAAAMALASLLGAPLPALAQPPAAGAAAGSIENEPVKCWWRATSPAVLVGERFTVVLTCGVVETRSLTAVPDTSQLEPTTIQVTPFEVVEGVRNQDVVAPPWRYFQYEYTLRLVGDGSFGRDVQVPSVKLTYSLRGSAGAGSEGREQGYALPPLPVRVLSLVSKQSTDIRDGETETFRGIEDRLFRATSEFVAAYILFGFAAILAIAALLRTLAARRRRVPVAAQPPAAGAVLRGCLQGARRVRSDVAGSGWTPDTVSAALASCRLAAAVALDRPFGYAAASSEQPLREGQVVLPHRPLQSSRTLVSAPTIPGRIERAVAELGERGLGGTRAAALVTLADALRTLEQARYQRSGTIDASALDAALESASGAMRRLWIASLWPLRLLGPRGGSRPNLTGAAVSQ